ncbi:hypothetical protein AB0L99_09295 [Streptomyces sp. NPDC051954]|uniref:hypothetical protein n=1 Tax=unclassified Streptomyces TaxID=2593676 RepID=UPI00344029C6
MGSLRNPVGPLPSSIYWRRRVVIVSVVALLALLVTWIVTMGGGGGKNGANGSNGDGSPTPSTITPGPSGSGPAISQAPGGRDETGDGDSNGSSSGSDSGSGDTGGTSDGANGDDGSAGGGSEGGAGSGTGDTLPAGSTLPNCTTGAVRLGLRSLHNAYGLGQTPSVELTATNSSGSDCKVDLGPESTVLTITQAGSDEDFWSSEDCPKTSGSLLYRVPAGSSVTYTVAWDRKASAPECGTPPAGSAAAGTYLVEATAPGFAKVQTSFVLEKD